MWLSLKMLSVFACGLEIATVVIIFRKGFQILVVGLKWLNFPHVTQFKEIGNANLLYPFQDLEHVMLEIKRNCS